MTQFIITLVVVFVAVLAAGYLIYKRFKKKAKKADCCNGCSEECGDCAFYREVQEKKK